MDAGPLAYLYTVIYICFGAEYGPETPIFICKLTPIQHIIPSCIECRRVLLRWLLVGNINKIQLNETDIKIEYIERWSEYWENIS